MIACCRVVIIAVEGAVSLCGVGRIRAALLSYSFLFFYFISSVRWFVRQVVARCMDGCMDGSMHARIEASDSYFFKCHCLLANCY